MPGTCTDWKDVLQASQWYSHDLMFSTLDHPVKGSLELSTTVSRPGDETLRKHRLHCGGV